MNIIKLTVKRIIQGNKATIKDYLEHLKRIGVKIGEEVIVFSPIHTTIDEQYPWMITIGNNVGISQGVIILTHDYSWAVLKKITGNILGNAKKVVIGNNVFIGMNALILGGAEIEDNVVIGAGSVVTQKCEANSVYAGVPARRIMSLQEYYEKRKNEQLKEAKNLATAYYNRFGRLPPKTVFHEFFMLFTSEKDLTLDFKGKMSLQCGYDESLKYLRKHKPVFDNFNDFIKYCFKEEKINVKLEEKN